MKNNWLRIPVSFVLLMIGGTAMYYAIYHNQLDLGVSASGRGLTGSWGVLLYSLVTVIILVLWLPSDFKSHSQAKKTRFAIVFGIVYFILTFVGIALSILIFVALNTTP